MPRPLRIQRVGCWYHVTARGNERREIFRDDRDRRHFVDLLEESVGLFALRLHAYVLMANHYHLLVDLTEPNLSRAIHWLNVSYTVWFNRRHGRSGHLFQGRFKSVLVEAPGWALELSRYIHLNPVRLSRLGLGKRQVQRSRSVGVEKVDARRVQERIDKLRRYPWSSYRAYIGTARKPGWLTTDSVLGMAGKGAHSAESYRKHCEQAVREGLWEGPWEKLIGKTVLGTQRYAAALAESLGKEDQRARNLRQHPDLDRIIAVVEELMGEKWNQFRNRYGDPGRDLVLYLGRTVGGLSIGELSRRAEIEYVSAATALRRFRARVEKVHGLAGLIQQAERTLNNE